MARLQRVLIDTSALFPFTIMDALLILAELAERIAVAGAPRFAAGVRPFLTH